MRRTLVSFALAICLFAGFSSADEDLGHVPGMVVVRFKPSAMPAREDLGTDPVTFHLADLDTVLERRRASRVARLLRTYGEETTSAGRILDRTFVIYYDDSTDAQIVASELSALPHFESVTVNHRLRKYYGGTCRFGPPDSEFPNQWNLDYENDRVDIDAPEAWYIERGDPSLVIGIIDLGTMINVGNGIEYGPYVLHSDNRFFFNDLEDNTPKSVLGPSDLDGGDGTDADNLALADNVIGYRFSSIPFSITDQLEQKFWRSMPHNWTVMGSVRSYELHGVLVASVAAANATGGSNIAGVANNCSVYILKDGSPGGSGTSSIIEEANALTTAADFSRVINMSWGFITLPLEPNLLSDAKNYALSKDCVLVAIAGNISDGSGTEVMWPGRYPDVLCVGNMDSTLMLVDSRFWSSSDFVNTKLSMLHT